MIIVQVSGTADNNDALSGTDLENIPQGGQLDLFATSTAIDTLLTITGPGQQPIVRARPVQQKTVAINSLQDDVPFSIPVSQGGHYVVTLDIQTAGTFALTAIWRSAAELGG